VVDIAERNGGTLERVLALDALGMANLLNQEWHAAACIFEEALAIARERRSGLQEEVNLLAYLSTAQLGLGDTTRARESAEEAAAVALRQGNKGDECDAHLARARVLLRAEGVAASGEIQAALSRVHALVEESGQRSHEPFIYEELAELARLKGDDATRRRELREAHRLFTEMGATGHAERLAKELGL
jgi:tetratricopeptide (TPR) repeat protein